MRGGFPIKPGVRADNLEGDRMISITLYDGDSVEKFGGINDYEGVSKVLGSLDLSGVTKINIREEKD
jgi:hypothetical protein